MAPTVKEKLWSAWSILDTYLRKKDSREQMMLAWVRMTPLGAPVDPDVYMMQKVSSRLGILVRSAGDSFPFLRRSSMWMSFPSRDSTTVRIVERRFCDSAKNVSSTPTDVLGQNRRTSSSHLPS